MSVTPTVLVPPLQMQATQTTQYSVPTSTKAIIDKATVTNTDTASRTFSVNLVTTGGSAGNDNLVIDDRAVAPGECYSCPELVGQVLEAGGFISTIASAASALTLRISGRQIT